VSFPLLTIFVVMEKFFSGYKRKYIDNEAGSSRETVCKKAKCRMYNRKYVSFEFINIDVNGEEGPQC